MSEECILGCEAGTRLLTSTLDSTSLEEAPESPETRPAFGSSRHAIGGVRVVQCKRCHLAWQDPMPDGASVKQAYDELRDDLYVEQAAGRQRSFRRSLRLVERYLSGPPGRLLDVGCSAGIFLQLARDAGWDVLGLEPSRWLFERAREELGEAVLQTTFEEAPLTAASFDLVTLWDVLEHVVDPAAVVEKCAEVLRSGGLLALNTPNVDSLIARSMGSRWPLLLPEHLYYYSPDSLEALLTRSGFRVLGTHLHFAFFGVDYVLHRLAQHRIPGIGWMTKLAGRLRMKKVQMPLLLGELTVFARRE